MPNHVLLDLAPSHRALEDYFMASSIDEALAYLMSHHGRAQVIAGGTRLVLRVQRDECLASHLVDVSSVGSMRRIALDDDHLFLGGALTLCKVGADERVRQSSPLLATAVQRTRARRQHRLATLAGEVVSAECPSLCSLALVALEARAEITNVTGSQWLPVGSLLVRPDVSRIDSTSEILTMFRIPLEHAGQGSALGQIETSAVNGTVSYGMALAMRISLTVDGKALDWLSVAITSPTRTAVHLVEAEEILIDDPVLDAEAGRRFALCVQDFARESLDWSEDKGAPLDESWQMALATFEQAIQSARSSLTDS